LGFTRVSFSTLFRLFVLLQGLPLDNPGWIQIASMSRSRRHTGHEQFVSDIRLSSKDLEAIQKRALAEGLPYQTLIASLLHKYAAGRPLEPMA
jgi:hypothetical protein